MSPDAHFDASLGSAPVISLPQLPTPIQRVTTPVESTATPAGDSRPTNASHTIKKPDGHIPRPPNCFILYRSWARKQKLNVSGSSKNEQSTCHRNVAYMSYTHLFITEVSKILGTLWAELPESTKDIFRQQAEVAKQAHKAKYPDYRYSPAANASPTSRPTRVKRKAQKMASSDAEECLEEAAKLKEAMVNGKGAEERQLEEELRQMIREGMATPPAAEASTPSPRFEVPRRSSSCPVPDFPLSHDVEAIARRTSRDDSHLPTHHTSFFPPYEPSSPAPRPRKKAKLAATLATKARPAMRDGMMTIPTLPTMPRLPPIAGSPAPPARRASPFRTTEPTGPITLPLPPFSHVDRPAPRNRMGVSTTGRIGPDPNFVFPPARTPLASMQSSFHANSAVASSFAASKLDQPTLLPLPVGLDRPNIPARGLMEIQNTTDTPSTTYTPRAMSNDFNRFLATDWANVPKENEKPVDLPSLTEYGFSIGPLPENSFDDFHFITPMGTFERRDSRLGSLSWLRRGSIGGMPSRRNSVFNALDRRPSIGMDIEDYSFAVRSVMDTV